MTDWKMMAQAAEEQEQFAATLGEGRIRPLQLAQVFPGIERQAVEIGVIDPETKHPNHVDMLYVCAIARHLRAGQGGRFFAAHPRPNQ